MCKIVGASLLINPKIPKIWNNLSNKHNKWTLKKMNYWNWNVGWILHLRWWLRKANEQKQAWSSNQIHQSLQTFQNSFFTVNGLNSCVITHLLPWIASEISICHLCSCSLRRDSNVWWMNLVGPADGCWRCVCMSGPWIIYHRRQISGLWSLTAYRKPEENKLWLNSFVLKLNISFDMSGTFLGFQHETHQWELSR